MSPGHCPNFNRFTIFAIPYLSISLIISEAVFDAHDNPRGLRQNRGERIAAVPNGAVGVCDWLTIDW
jgi:hypothetical protein